jgi:hypothetical protein
MITESCYYLKYPRLDSPYTCFAHNGPRTKPFGNTQPIKGAQQHGK